MKILAPVARQTFFAYGMPAVGYHLYSYKAGTTELMTTYQDVEGLNPHSNPIVLDESASVKFYVNVDSYKLQLRTPAGVIIWTEDNIAPVPADSIGEIQLKDNSVTEPKIASNAIAERHFQTGAIPTVAYKAKSVTGAKIADATITAANIKNSAVGEDQLSSSSVTADKISANAIVTGKIQNLAVTEGKVANKAISVAKLAEFVQAKGVFVAGNTSDTAWTTLATINFVAGAEDNARPVWYGVQPSITGSSIFGLASSDGVGALRLRVRTTSPYPGTLGLFEIQGANVRVPLTLVHGCIFAWGVFPPSLTTTVVFEASSSSLGKSVSWGAGDFLIWQI